MLKYIIIISGPLPYNHILTGFGAATLSLCLQEVPYFNSGGGGGGEFKGLYEKTFCDYAENWISYKAPLPSNHPYCTGMSYILWVCITCKSGIYFLSCKGRVSYYIILVYIYVYSPTCHPRPIYIATFWDIYT